jgi:hypothetical protein
MIEELTTSPIKDVYMPEMQKRNFDILKPGWFFGRRLIDTVVKSVVVVKRWKSDGRSFDVFSF